MTRGAVLCEVRGPSDCQDDENATAGGCIEVVGTVDNSGGRAGGSVGGRRRQKAAKGKAKENQKEKIKGKKISTDGNPIHFCSYK